jgi:hypothetical protein
VKTSTFVSGLAVVVVAMILGLVGLGVLNSRQSRPEGVAENWLTDVGDTTRKGVEADARRRAEKIGPLSLVDTRLLRRNQDGKAGFADLEVGKAVQVQGYPGGVWVRFRVHTRRGSNLVKVNGFLGVEKNEAGAWNVVNVVLGEGAAGGDTAPFLRAMPALPSDGGPPPSSAPLSLWIGAVVGAAIIGVLTSAVVRIAGRATPAAVTA